MNQPTVMTRFLGRPRVAAALYVGCALAVLGWFGGAVPWWLGLMALCFVGTVRGAVREVRRYNDWWAAWQSMGSAPSAATAEPAVRGRKASSPRFKITVAALSLIVIPLLASLGDATFRLWLTLLWLGIAVYLVRKLASVRRSRVRGGVAGTVSAGARKKGAAPDVVAWVLPRASSSPSRADAMRRLPDYCARLLAVESARKSA
jgi:hypothetical protein